MFIAEDLNQFKELFVSKLKGMLSDDELGAFILVLANSQQDAFLKKQLADDLQTTFCRMKNNFSAGSLNAPQDDIDVFKQLMDVELHDIQPWQYKTVGDWEVAYNSMRQLRPARASSQILSSTRQAFDDSKFHFNKPFLKPEILWEGEHKGLSSRVLYNKFPFADYHLLIVLSPQEKSSQLLTHDAHNYVFSLVAEMSEKFPGFGVGFNSLAAGASVNHFHFQGFIREQNFPVENIKRDGAYPVNVEQFIDSESAWAYVQSLIEQDIAFNCLYRKNACYVFARNYQGAVELPSWLTGAGWLDVAGVVTVSDSESFQHLTKDEIYSGLSLLRTATATTVSQN